MFRSFAFPTAACNYITLNLMTLIGSSGIMVMIGYHTISLAAVWLASASITRPVAFVLRSP